MAAPQSGIIRTAKDREHPYQTMNTSVFQNNSLSLEARGLLGYLLSKPDDWEVRFADLIANAAGPNCGEDRLRRILKELEAAGYIIRTRRNIAHGRFEWVTTVYETPHTDVTISVKTADGQKRIRKPKSPSAGLPHMANTIYGKPADIQVTESISPKGESAARKTRTRPPAQKKPTDEKPSTPTAIIQALADACLIDRQIARKATHVLLADTASRIYAAGQSKGQTDEQITDAIRYVGEWFKREDWRGKKGEAPTPSQILDVWRQAIEARDRPQPASASRALNAPPPKTLISREEAERARLATADIRPVRGGGR